MRFPECYGEREHERAIARLVRDLERLGDCQEEDEEAARPVVYLLRSNTGSARSAEGERRGWPGGRP